MKIKILLSSVLISSIMLTGCTEKVEVPEKSSTLQAEVETKNNTQTSEENTKIENEYFTRLNDLINGTVKAGKDLSLEDKLAILCESMKDTYKKVLDNGSIS